MLARSFMTRAGAVAAIAATLGATAIPNVAYAKHGDGAGIALGIIGGMLAGAAIASSQSGYAAPPAYYYPQPPRVYYSPPPYYEPPTAYYAAPSWYSQPDSYGYTGYGN
jgi:hypothetical protein